MRIGNGVNFIGRLTADPELRTTPNGKMTTSFTLARNRTFGTEDNQADFVNFVAWNATAEFIVKYFKKGSLMGVTGEIRTRSYTNANDVKVFVTEILVENVDFIGSKQGTENEGNEKAEPVKSNKKENYKANTNSKKEPAADDDDDLPY